MLRDYGHAKTTFGRVSKMLPGNSEVHRPSARLPDARDTGIKAWPTSSKPSPWTHAICELLMDAACDLRMLRQFPAALKLDDQALDITPDDPDMMASKASIYQAQGNLQEAAKLLSEITGRNLLAYLRNKGYSVKTRTKLR